MNDSPTVLITGGSHGIGLELARLFARDGYRLILVSKPPKELAKAKALLEKSFPGVEIHTQAIDLAVPEAPPRVHAYVQGLGKPVDVLVNNAGFGSYGFINEVSVEKELTMIQLHVATLYHLTRLFLEDMIERNKGHIINLSSISALQPSPMLSTYAATKSFVLQFSRAINYELKEKGTQVRVTAVCPMATRGTGFQSGADMDNTNTFDNWMTTTPEVVARDAYAALKSKRDIVIPGQGFELLQRFVRHLPDWLQMRIARENLKRR